MHVTLEDYAWAAGVATDLVNTTSTVWRGTGDRLAHLDDLADFIRKHAQGDPDDARGGEDLLKASRAATEADLEAVHLIRDQVRDLIDDPEPGRLARRASSLTSGIGELQLLPARAGTPARWAAVPAPGASLGQQLALVSGVGVLGVLRALGADRFRQCGAPTCQGAFIDTTRPGSRKFCMPGLCGNRLNVANHRRRRATPDP